MNEIFNRAKRFVDDLAKELPSRVDKAIAEVDTLRWSSEYSQTETYARGSIVRYRNQLWVALQEVRNEDPASSKSWDFAMEVASFGTAARSISQELQDLFSGYADSAVEMRKGSIYLYQAMDASLDTIIQWELSDGSTYPSSLIRAQTQAGYFGASSGTHLVPGTGFTVGPSTFGASNQSNDSYGNDFIFATAAGGWIEYQSPSNTTDFIWAGLTRPEQGSFALVTINGDATAANDLPTAQDLVTSGDLAASALVGGGGTLNPTDRLLDGYTSSYLYRETRKVASGLTAGVHTVRFTSTAYFNTASGGGAQPRHYVSGVGYRLSSSTPSFSNEVIGLTVSIINSVESAFEYALQLRPNGGTNEWVGGVHGNETLVSTTGMVDGVNSALVEYTPQTGTASVGFNRICIMEHTEVGTIGVSTITYTVTDKLEVNVNLSFSSAMEAQRCYTGMFPTRQPDFLRSSIIGAGVNYTSTGSGTLFGKLPAAISYIWSETNNAGVMFYSPNLANSVDNYVSANDVDLFIEDRATADFTKSYMTRIDNFQGSISSSETWDYTNYYYAQQFVDAEASLASI